MSFSPDPSKLAQEVIFSRKLRKTDCNPACFNHNSIQQVPSQKHLEMYLHAKLIFQDLKTIRLLRERKVVLPSPS